MANYRNRKSFEGLNAGDVITYNINGMKNAVINFANKRVKVELYGSSVDNSNTNPKAECIIDTSKLPNSTFILHTWSTAGTIGRRFIISIWRYI